MSEHTEGPWKAEPNYRSTGWYVNQPKNCRQLAIVNQQDAGIERDECEANARLIAAAPQLLAACEAALEAFEWTERALPEDAVAIVTLRSAIAAARSEKGEGTP